VVEQDQVVHLYLVVQEEVHKQEELEDLQHQDKVMQVVMEDPLLNQHQHKIIQQEEVEEQELQVQLDY
jgi:hypothetical protein